MSRAEDIISLLKNKFPHGPTSDCYDSRTSPYPRLRFRKNYPSSRTFWYSESEASEGWPSIVSWSIETSWKVVSLLPVTRPSLNQLKRHCDPTSQDSQYIKHCLVQFSHSNVRAFFFNGEWEFERFSTSPWESWHPPRPVSRELQISIESFIDLISKEHELFNSPIGDPSQRTYIFQEIPKEQASWGRNTSENLCFFHFAIHNFRGYPCPWRDPDLSSPVADGGLNDDRISDFNRVFAKDQDQKNVITELIPGNDDTGEGMEKEGEFLTPLGFWDKRLMLIHLERVLDEIPAKGIGLLLFTSSGLIFDYHRPHRIVMDDDCSPRLCSPWREFHLCSLVECVLRDRENGNDHCVSLLGSTDRSVYLDIKTELEILDHQYRNRSDIQKNGSNWENHATTFLEEHLLEAQPESDDFYRWIAEHGFIKISTVENRIDVLPDECLITDHLSSRRIWI